MKKVGCLLLSTLFCLSVVPAKALAGAAVPEMYGVREVVIGHTRFDDPKSSDICGLSRDLADAVFIKSFKSTSVPAVSIEEARPPIAGIFRIQLMPEISTYVDENMGCVSWISMSAENRISVLIPPLNVLRTVTAVYWRKHVKISSNQSTHPQKVTETLQKVSDMFAQQFRTDQPPELPE